MVKYTEQEILLALGILKKWHCVGRCGKEFINIKVPPA